MANDERPSIRHFSVDISTVEAPDPLPAGDYPATIQRAAVRESKAGNEYVSVMFHIRPEDYPVDYEVENAPDGTQLSYNRVPWADDRRSHYQLRKFCEAIGADMSANININDWMHHEATVSIEHGTWEGEDRAEIRRVSPSA